MEHFHDEDLPAELRHTARVLREQRHEASAFELDDIKRRVSKRAQPRRSLKGRYMHRPTTLTAGLVVGALASGSAGALAMTGNLPATKTTHASAGKAHRSSLRAASQGQYQRECDEFQRGNDRNERRNADADRRAENERFQGDRASEAARRNADRAATDRIRNASARRKAAARLRQDRIRASKKNRQRRIDNSNRDRNDESAQRQQDNEDVARCRAGQ